MDSEEADNGSDSPNPPILGGDPILSQFIENMGLHYEKYGVARIGGRILGLLMLTPRSISAEEMAEALQVSRSSISTNLRMLLMAGLVEKVSLPGERCDYFEFSDSAWQRLLELRLEGVLSLKEVAEEGMLNLEQDHPGRQRLQEMVHWVEMLNQAYEQVSSELQSHQEVPA